MTLSQLSLHGFKRCLSGASRALNYPQLGLARFQTPLEGFPMNMVPAIQPSLSDVFFEPELTMNFDVFC